MNIFYLDHSPRKCAEYLHDCHLNKMTTEITQIISTTLWKLNCGYAEVQFAKGKLYTPTHVNHPCCIWARTSFLNFIFCIQLLMNMEVEWQYRKGKHHGACTKCWDAIRKSVHFLSFDQHSFTPPPQCMPEKYRSEDVLSSYRHYYNCEKQTDKNGKFIANYTKRSKPYWMMTYEV